MVSPTALGPALWLTALDGVPPPEAEALLSDDEKRRAERIRHEATRTGFIAGRALARHALSRHIPIDPRDWRFSLTALGRPEIEAPSHTPGLRFNLSHSAGLVACLTTSESDCGIDVESVDRPVDCLRIARHSFTAEEVDVLERLSGEARRRRFFALWTLKEAYVKARGSGLRLRLDSAAFALEPGGRLRVRLACEDSAAWRFALFRPAHGHLLATALAETSSHEGPLGAWRIDLASGKATPIELTTLALGPA